MAIKHASKVIMTDADISDPAIDFLKFAVESTAIEGEEPIRKATVGALNDAALSIEQQATQLVPFDEGILAASSSIAEPKLTATSKSTSVGVRYGGPSGVKGENVNYAIIQHEDTSLKHTGGRQAKYLETPFLAEISTYPAGLGKRIKQQGLDQI